MPAKKTTTKKAAKSASPVAKKAPTKKAPAKKVAAKKATPAPAKKAAKKSPAKKTTTTIVANVDVGFGNSLFIRGEGAGLSWEKGTALENISPYEWSFSTGAKGPITFKFLINDEIWAEGENLTVAAGNSSISSPAFS